MPSSCVPGFWDMEFNWYRPVRFVFICAFVPEYGQNFSSTCKFMAFIPPFIHLTVSGLSFHWSWHMFPDSDRIAHRLGINCCFLHRIAATAAALVGFFLHSGCLWLQTLRSFLMGSEGASELTRRAIGSPPK